jgi:hypothetical protein
MEIVIIGIVMVVVGCIILGWLIKESYKNFKGTSTKSKILHLIWVILGVLLDKIVLFGLILLGVLLIVYQSLFI